MKQWNIGNTTVRNPERIKDGLRLLSEKFSGKTFTLDVQDEYYIALHDAKLIKGNPPKAESKRELARKWAAAFNQLGLAKCWQRKPPIEITQAGQALLSNSTIDEDVYLRQILKIQNPSPTEPRIEGASFHPFYLVLGVTQQLHKLGLTGITKEEIALYLQTSITDDSIEWIVAQIQSYRTKRKSITGRAKKRKFYISTATERLKELYSDELEDRLYDLNEIIKGHREHGIYYLRSDQAKEILEKITATGKGAKVQSAVDCRHKLIISIESYEPIEETKQILTDHFLGLKRDTLGDYSDTTIRYSRITGLFTITGDKLAIKEDQLRLAEQILAQGKPALLDKKDFLIKFYSSQYPILPTEDSAFLREDIKALHKNAIALEERTNVGTVPDIQLAEDTLLLRKQRQVLEKEIKTRKEIEFYKSQRNADQISAIKDLFESIDNKEIIGGSDYYPAIIEWAVWRVFLSIDTISIPIDKTRNFEIDSDLHPIHHAKSGVADMVFEYPESFILPTEVTLNLSDRQYSAEREPVQTHVLRITEANPDKEVIGVFIAPEINPRTAFEFFKDRSGVYSQKLKRSLSLSIVPLSVTQLISFLPGEINACSNSSDLHQKLNSLLTLAHNCADGVEWLTTIQQTLAT